MEFELYTSSFCGACRTTRRVLDDAVRLVPGATVTELPIESEPDRAEAADIRSTPTVILRDHQGQVRFRAIGVPTVPQVLTAAAQLLA
ncbi:thioredoxin domain-containing protein [Parenemella sanctibonifatiensis]|uniref:Thiol reductase thioredoxin n=1 Tax=Parenemella sanctibonifatiensis TaxID=2016505 RepID=A0A255ENI2_9ACTN|nr:thiol reductase thioredoxin [Parenemella sanctibonifatiensis]OYN91165.1 thiol reductase thioredoxin [Parenemella sanctibonifatiensis]